MNFIERYGVLDLGQPWVDSVRLLGFSLSRSQANLELTTSTVTSLGPPSGDCPGTLTCYLPKRGESFDVMSHLQQKVVFGDDSPGGLNTISVYTVKVNRKGKSMPGVDYSMFRSVFVSGNMGTFVVQNTQEGWSENWNAIKLSFAYERLKIEDAN